ncbi:MAG: sensor histidine kinase [Ignavibacteriales bacterium]|nr:sensor histidine kinase [Ignavibacteriales bacterium]
MIEYFSISNPVIFILLITFIILSGLYIIRVYLFTPLREKHFYEKQKLELKNEKLLSLFASSSPNPLFRFNAIGTILMTNASGQVLLDSINTENNMFAMFPNLKTFNFVELINSSGTHSFVSLIGEKSFTVLLIGLGDLGFGHAYCTDITERISYEIKLKSSQEHLRELTLRLQDASELMKITISMELHDGVCQTLSSIKLMTGKMETYLIPDEKAKKLLQEILVTTDGALNELKSLSYHLTPKFLQEFGLIAGIQALIMQIEVANGLKGKFQVIGKEIRLASKLEINLYRIVQELLSNIIKHARAGFFSVQFIFEPQKVTLVVENDGIGFNVDTKLIKGGLGLLDISERVACFNGTVTISSSEETGTETIIELPIGQIHG